MNRTKTQTETKLEPKTEPKSKSKWNETNCERGALMSVFVKSVKKSAPVVVVVHFGID